MEILLQRQVVEYHRSKPSNVYIVNQMVSANFEKRNITFPSFGFVASVSFLSLLSLDGQKKKGRKK